MLVHLPTDHPQVVPVVEFFEAAFFQSRIEIVEDAQDQVFAISNPPVTGSESLVSQVGEWGEVAFLEVA